MSKTANMFKPFDLFYKKAVKKEENAQTDVAELRTLYNQLSKKKLKKFIKKAEKDYDKYVEENGNEQIGPFITFLNKKETQLLFESYGLPEKLPHNSMYYFTHRDGPSELERNTQAWLKMTPSEKEEIFKEFVEFQTLNQQMFFEFARNLPEKRCIDYQLNIAGRKKIIEAGGGNKSLNKLSKKEANGGGERIRTQKVKLAYPTPFEVYRNENPDMKFLEARANFSAFKEEDLMKYIKKAESIYDKKKDDSQRPKLYTILNKNEMKLLFQSYGMPQEVPNNVSSYYFKLHSKDFVGGKDSMKSVFENFKKMSPEEKEAFTQKHFQDTEEFLALQRTFQENLPDERKSDYMDWKINSKTIKVINVERIKNTRKKSLAATSNQDDDSEIKQESHDENGLNDTESEIGSVKNDPVHKKAESPKKSKKEVKILSPIDEFIANGPRKPENVLSVFLQEKMKWLPQVKMTEADTQSFLSKAVKEWNNLNENEKASFEEKLKKSKKEFKNKIKEFLMNKSITDTSEKELTQRIMDYSLREDKKIEITMDESDSQTILLTDNLGRLHSAVKEIDMTSENKKNQLNGKNSNKEEKKLKRRLESDNTVVNKQSKAN